MLDDRRRVAVLFGWSLSSFKNGRSKFSFTQARAGETFPALPKCKLAKI